MQLDTSRAPKFHVGVRTILWTVVLLLLYVAYLLAHPWELEQRDEQAQGVSIAREAQSDVVVVLDYDHIVASAPSFSKHDWSAAWINTLEQEVGPVTIATPRSLSHKALAQAKVIVLTSSVTQGLSRALMQTLRASVEAGHLLVVERPGGLLRQAFSADGRAGSQRATKVSFAKGLAQPYLDQLLRLPLSTEFVGSTQALAGGTTWLAIDGAPVIYSKPLGKGHVVTVDFDFGEQMVAMQQGRPGEDFALRSPTSRAPRSGDLMMDPKLAGELVPMADLLERFLVHGVLGRLMPLATLWPFPHGAMGVIVSVHPDEELGDGGGWMLDYELEKKGFSTLLTSNDARLTAAGAAILHRKGGEIGLLWKKSGSPGQMTERLGFGALKPLSKPVGLHKQLEQLKKTLPVDYVRVARIGGGWWSRRWDEPFAMMAAQQLRVDVSYELDQTSGYAFGTGLPFLALRADGMPLGVRELPVVMPDRPLHGPSMTTLLESSQQGHHMAITASLDPTQFAQYPDLEQFESWLAMFEEMARTKHRMLSAYRFDTFMRTRRASSLTSRVIPKASMRPTPKTPMAESVQLAAQKERNRKKNRKTPLAPPPPPPPKPATILRLSLETKAHGMSVMVPRVIEGRRFHAARPQSQRLDKEGGLQELDTAEVTLIGYEFLLVPLERGFNALDLYYLDPPHPPQESAGAP